MFLQEVIEFMKSLQDEICNSLEKLDKKSVFEEDLWDRAEGGGGRTRVTTNGNLIEKGGVNFSHVMGEIPVFLKESHPTATKFDATGVSIVLHSNNPFVPIIHMNVRYFQMDTGVYWFGGGIDVSPAYPNEKDSKSVHQHLKMVCDEFSSTFYPKFKSWCDTYFTIKHRKEMRGIGGIFFDHLDEKEGLSKTQLFDFVKAVGEAFVPIYTNLVAENRSEIFNDQHKKWQMVRRGRYVEFNLVYDRGTHFGLQTNGRIESILMSLPPLAAWEYNYVPVEGSEEANSLQYFQPKDWII